MIQIFLSRLSYIVSKWFIETTQSYLSDSLKQLTTALVRGSKTTLYTFVDREKKHEPNYNYKESWASVKVKMEASEQYQGGAGNKVN